MIDRADGGQGVEALTGDHRDLDEKRRSENKMRVLWVCRNWWALRMAENGLTVFLLRSSAVLLTYKFGVWIPEQGGSSAHQHETTRRRLIWTIISSYPKAVLCPVYPGPQSKKRKRKQNQNQTKTPNNAMQALGIPCCLFRVPMRQCKCPFRAQQNQTPIAMLKANPFSFLRPAPTPFPLPFLKTRKSSIQLLR